MLDVLNIDNPIFVLMAFFSSVFLMTACQLSKQKALFQINWPLRDSEPDNFYRMMSKG